MRLKFLHLHLHGLIRSKNLELGRDPDTGGQTQYVLELVKSLANTSEVDQVDLSKMLIFQKFSTIFCSLTPLSSKWWCSGVIKNMRLPP